MRFDHDVAVSVFETNIRIVGGALFFKLAPCVYSCEAHLFVIALCGMQGC